MREKESVRGKQVEQPCGERACRTGTVGDLTHRSLWGDQARVSLLTRWVSHPIHPFPFLPLSISSLSSHFPPIFPLNLVPLLSTLSLFSLPIQRTLYLHSRAATHPDYGSLPIAPHSRADAHRPPTSHDMSCVRIISTHISPRRQDGQIVDAMPCQTLPVAAFLDVLYFCRLTL